jgi:transcriptional regulator GlxA family with amidase domain
LLAHHLQSPHALSAPEDFAAGCEAGVTDPLVTRAQLLIQQRFTSPIDYAALAQQLSVSQRTLIRHFNRHLQCTPQSYQQQLRMEAARRLLETTRLRIASVAERVGYANVAFFNRLFQAHVGISALSYRDARQRTGISTRAPAPPNPV